MSSSSGIQGLVNEYFEPMINTDGSSEPSQAPGGICGVFYDGEVTYYPYGYINDAGDAPTKNTVFGLASVTKVLTTSILGQQVEPSFNTSVNAYLPAGYDLTIYEQPVTFAQLATFTGGINPSIPPKGHRKKPSDFRRFINGRVPSDHTLPTPNEYSNSSIGFLAQILMDMSDIKTFGQTNTNQWFQNNLLTALYMNHTGAPAPTDGNHPLSEAYTFEDGAYDITRYDGWCPWGAAGRAYATCSDMMIFVQANAGCSTINGHRVPQEILDGMVNAQKWLTPQSGSDRWAQGFAWRIFDWDTPPAISGKGGYLSGVSCYVTVCPAQQLGVVFLTNLCGVIIETPAIDMTRGLLAL